MPAPTEVLPQGPARRPGTPDAAQILGIRFADPRLIPVIAREAAVPRARLDATPLDLGGAAKSREGRRSTFDRIGADRSLGTPAWQCLAVMIRAADPGRHNLVPQVTGLFAVALGLSRMVKNALTQIEAKLVSDNPRDGFNHGQGPRKGAT